MSDPAQPGVDPLALFPRSERVADLDVRFRLMGEGDREAVLAFTRQLPERDKLFLRIDITDPEVVDRWIAQILRGKTVTLLAEEGRGSDFEVVGYGSLHHSEILWTRHLGEMRLLVGSAFRGKGLGGCLGEQVFEIAQHLGLHKLVVQMPSTQRSAQQLFHQLGFVPEALLHDWVIDQGGRTHDLIVMSRELDDGGE